MKVNKTYVVIILLLLVVTGLTGYIVYDKLSRDDNVKENIDKDNDEDIVYLKYIYSSIVNREESDSSDKDIWYLAKTESVEGGFYGYDDGDYIRKVDSNIANQIVDFHGSIYYYNDVVYTSKISNKKLIINKVNLVAEKQIYNNYINMDMPSDYKLCGTWEGQRVDNDCDAEIIYMNEKNMYIFTRNENFEEEIYILDISTSNGKLERVYTSSNTASLKAGGIFAYVHNNALIIVGQDGISVGMENGNNIKNVFSLSVNDSNKSVRLDYDNIYIKNNQLYYSVIETQYKDNSNDRTETIVNYRYNFSTKEAVIINK